MIFISEFKIDKLCVPLGRAVGDNNCTYEAFDVCVVQLRANDGLVGWGFGEKAHGGRFLKPVSWKGEMGSPSQLEAAFRLLWPKIQGRGPENLLTELPKAWQAGEAPGYLMASLRMALWDLVGKAAGKPLYQYLGGDDAPSSAFTYASPCGFPQTDDWLVDYFTAKVKQGFTAIKVKVGHADIERDITRLKRIREAVGPEVEIAVDGNTAWDGRQTLAWIERVERAGIGLGYLEDPVSPDDLESYTLLAKESPLPIVGHDYIPDPEQLRPLLDSGAIQRLRLRDGIDYGIAAAGIADEYGLKVIQCNTFGEHGAHFSLGCPHLDRIEFAELGWNNLFEDPFRITAGRLIAPNGFGHGLVPKADLLQRWQANA